VAQGFAEVPDSSISAFVAHIRPSCVRWGNYSWGSIGGTVQVAAPRAQADPARPIFHVTALAQWINDPNGPIHYKGFYHLFYQLHPFSDQSGPKYWGHVRSRDLAKWEPLPIALWPSSEAGEAEVWSGCCTINGQGEPMIFYTSIVSGKSARTISEICDLKIGTGRRGTVMWLMIWLRHKRVGKRRM
jgi:hypothetical protein